MTPKKIIFSVLCVLLVIVIVMTGIVVNKFTSLIQSMMGSNTPDPTDPTDPTDPSDAPTVSTDGATEPTDDPTEPTDAPTAPTDAPTEPTDAPTVPTEPGHVHNYQLTDSANATCEDYGYAIYTCTSCGNIYIPVEEQVAPYGHNYGAGQIIDATCTEVGCTRYTCSRCGLVDDRNVVDATGHDFQFTETVVPTCSAAGYDIYTCTVCGETEKRNELPASDHAYGVYKEVFPTCTESGHTVYRCEYCNDEYTDAVVPATGHLFTSWEAQADGSYSRYCLYCDLVESSGDLHITKAIVTGEGEYVEDRDGNVYKMYWISVGTDTSNDLFHYYIHDYLHNGTISYYYDPAEGFVITYQTSDGASHTLTLPILENSLATITDEVATADTAPEETLPE